MLPACRREIDLRQPLGNYRVPSTSCGNNAGPRRPRMQRPNDRKHCYGTRYSTAYVDTCAFHSENALRERAHRC